MLLRWISWRRVLRAPLRSFLIISGIALGVAALVSTLAVAGSIRGAFTEMAERVAGRASLVVTGGEVGVDPELVAAISELPGVAHTAGTVEVVTHVSKEDGPILVLGVDFVGDRHFLPIAGEDEGAAEVVDDPLAFINDPRGILIAASLARRHQLHAGDSIELLTPGGKQPFKVWGLLEDSGLARAFGGQIAVMFQDAAMLTFGRDRIDRIEVALAPETNLEEARARIGALLGGRGRVERPEGRARHLTSILVPIERGLNVASALALLVGMFIIYNAVGVAVAQRRREVGVLRALGVRRRAVVALFSLEAALLAAIGGAAGIGLGKLIARIALHQTAAPISRFYAAIRPREAEIDLRLALLGLMVGVIAALVSAFGPARLAATVDPAESLRPSALLLTRRPIRHRTLLAISGALLVPAALMAQVTWMSTGFLAMAFLLAAAVLAVPALILSLRRAVSWLAGPHLGIPGRLAIDHAVQRLDRSTVIVGALMLSVSTSVCLASWGAAMERAALYWLDRALPSDLYVTAGSVVADQQNVPFKPEVLEKLQGLPGAQEIYPARIVQVDHQGGRLLIVALGAADYLSANQRKGMAPIVLDGPDPIPLERLTERPGALLSENAARRLGLHAGDHLVVETAVGPRDIEVVAVIVDYVSDLGAVLIDRRWYLEMWQDPLIDTVDIALAPGVPLEPVREEIRRRLGMGQDLFIVSAQDMRGEIQRVLIDAMAIFRSTEVIALLVALLGVVGIMLAAVIDRTREIGVLRAIGASRRQIVHAVMIEAGFLGLASALGGVLAGVPMGWVFTRVVALASTGWLFQYVFPLGATLRVAILVVSTAALAGLWPGRKAAQLDVPEALAYE